MLQHRRGIFVLIVTRVTIGTRQLLDDCQSIVNKIAFQLSINYSAGMEKDEMLSVTQSAAVLGRTRAHVHNLIADGLLPAQRVGNAYVIRRGDLAKVPKDRKPGPKPKGK